MHIKDKINCIMLNLKFVQKLSWYTFKRCVHCRSLSLYLKYYVFYYSFKSLHKHQQFQNIFKDRYILFCLFYVLLYFSITIYYSLYISLPNNHYTVVHVHEFFSFLLDPFTPDVPHSSHPALHLWVCLYVPC